MLKADNHLSMELSLDRFLGIRHKEGAEPALDIDKLNCSPSDGFRSIDNSTYSLFHIFCLTELGIRASSGNDADRGIALSGDLISSCIAGFVSAVLPDWGW